MAGNSGNGSGTQTGIIACYFDGLPNTAPSRGGHGGGLRGMMPLGDIPVMTQIRANDSRHSGDVSSSGPFCTAVACQPFRFGIDLKPADIAAGANGRWF